VGIVARMTRMAADDSRYEKVTALARSEWHFSTSRYTVFKTIRASVFSRTKGEVPGFGVQIAPAVLVCRQSERGERMHVSVI